MLPFQLNGLQSDVESFLLTESTPFYFYAFDLYANIYLQNGSEKF